MDRPSPINLDEIEDPGTGLALLSKRPDTETPEQTLNRSFWQLQFMYWRDWRAGAVPAVAAALTLCSLSKTPPPSWLCEAIRELCEQSMSDDDKRAYADWAKHTHRWRAVRLARGQYPGAPRNYERKARGDAVWTEAAKLVAGTDAEASAETVRKSYALIRRAGGGQAMLQSYKRAAER